MVDCLVETDRGLIALEVTSVVNSEFRDLAAELTLLNGESEELVYEWSLTVPWSFKRPGRNVFRRRLISILKTVEMSSTAREFELFGGSLDTEGEANSPYIAEILQLKDMGFFRAHATFAELRRHGSIYIGLGGLMSPGNPASSLIERRDKKIKKLLAFPNADRHLFVWVHETEPAMLFRLLAMNGPTEAIELSGLDRIWIAPWQENTFAEELLSRTWMLTSGGNWQRAVIFES